MKRELKGCNIIKLVLVFGLGATSSVNVGAQIWGLSKFAITQSDDRFSTDGMTSWMSKWNRISKRSIGGGRHIDARGVFFDPFAMVDRTNGKLRGLGFVFSNSYWRDTISGAPLSIGRPLMVTFLTGEGAPIALKINDIKHTQSDLPNCDRVTLNCTSEEADVGTIDLTLEQYRRIMKASALAAKIEGSDKNWVYEAKDVDPNFFDNLKRFYEERLVGAE